MGSAVDAVLGDGIRRKKDWFFAGNLTWRLQCELASKSSLKKEQFVQVPPPGLSRTGLTKSLRWGLKEPLELEGLLGLWLWSVESDPVMEKTVLPGQFTVSRAAEISPLRVVTNRVDVATQLRTWGPHAHVVQTRLCLNTSEQGNPSIIFDNRKQGPLKTRFTDVIHPTIPSTYRFFGWFATESPEGTDDIMTACTEFPTASLAVLFAQISLGLFFRIF
ncbi:hypothetical protein BDV12DRAFT_198407 [Aspergillus spectabilis]